MIEEDKAQLRRRPVIRVFVSSTFTDLKHERDALQRDVFPKLEQLCASRQFQFQAIDLRWGVPTEASLDHRTMQICFEELRRSQEISPQPNFLILLGNRYGWRPLPEEVSEDEFRRLEQAASSIPGGDILSAWYRRDENAVPPVHILQSRKQVLSDGRDYTNDQVWNEVQRVLWDVINHAYPAAQLAERFDNPAALDVPLPAIVRFQASAAEQEIWRGAVGVPNASQHVLAFVREIENIEEFQRPVEIRDFVDVDESGAIDAVSQAAIRQLKEQLRTRLGEGNVIGIEHARLTRSANEKGEPSIDVTARHLEELCARVQAALEAIIHRQINEYWGTSGADIPSARELELERLEHQRFGQERAPAGSFVGRERHLQAIKAYLLNDSHAPLVIHGASGCGKTALLARAAQEAAQDWKPIVRFIGVTPRSSDIRSLLASLCQELRERHPLDTPLPGDVHELTRELQEHFKAAAAHEPLILFLDALDQLADAENGRSLFWIPFGPLPSHVKLIVSCLSDRAAVGPDGQPYAALKRRGLAEEDFINLDALSEDEAHTLLFERWFPQAKRTLNHEQAQRVRERLTSDACRLPLYLKALFEEARLWRSYGSVPRLGDNVSELLGALFNRLSDPANHGETVECALGYIASARRGLTEMEILEVLYHDPDYKKFLDKITAKTGHKLPDDPQRIPIAIWSRLRFDLAPYLAEHAAPGGTVLNFYHRQVGEYVRGCCLDTPEKRQIRHKRLAEYFRRAADPEGRGEWNGNSARALRELPFHTAGSNNQAEVVALLTSLPYLSARVAAGSAYQLAEDYALTAGSPEFLEWRDFILRHSQRLTDHPKMLVALVQHEGFPSARLQVSSRTWRHPWLRSWEEPAPPGRPALPGLHLEIKADKQFPRGRVGAVAWQARLIFSVERLGAIGIVDYRDMQELLTCVPIGTGRPVRIACAPDASNLLVIFEPGEAELHRCTLGSDGRPVASELVARFRCSLPEIDDPIVEWHDGAYWMQIQPGMLARVDEATAEVSEEPLHDSAPSELAALLFLEGGRRFVAVRQAQATVLGGTDRASVRREASELCTTCACGDRAAAFFADGHAALFDVTEGPVPTATIQAGTLRGAAGWDGEWLLWLKESPDFARLHGWRPDESEARLVQGGQKVFPAGLYVIPRTWGHDGEGGALVLTTHSIVRFHVAEGGSLRAGRLESLFGGATWRAVRKEDGAQWLWDGPTGREVCLGRDVPGRLYCAPDGRGLLYTARVDRPGLVWDLASFQTAPLYHRPMLLNMAVGDPEKGCWFSDRKGGVYYAGDDPEVQLAATVEEGTGAVLHVCGEYLLWRGTIPHFYPDMGVEQARAFVFFRRRLGTESPLERVGERLFAVREGLCIALDYDHTRGRLVLLWQPEGKDPVLRTATVEEFLADRFLDRELQGAGLLGDSRIAISPDGRVLGIINSGRELVCVSMDTGELVASLAGSLPFTHIAPGGKGISFWLVQAQDVVYGCTLVEPA